MKNRDEIFLYNILLYYIQKIMLKDGDAGFDV